MEIRYPAKFKREENSIFVEFPDLPDTFTEGKTEEEALFNAAEVLTAMLNWRLDNDKPIPPPTAKLTNAYYVAPDAKTQAALLVRYTRTESEFSVADLARTLETSWPAAARLEDAHHWPTLKQLEKVAAAMGKRLVLAFE
ncbi:MAG: type II toxin-antitoxin system HicB family antitoxin [Pseudomonadota bacterium]